MRQFTVEASIGTNGFSNRSQLKITIDNTELSELVDALSALRRKSSFVVFSSLEWGVGDLTPEFVESGSLPIHQIKIRLISNEVNTHGEVVAMPDKNGSVGMVEIRLDNGARNELLAKLEHLRRQGGAFEIDDLSLSEEKIHVAGIEPADQIMLLERIVICLAPE